MHRPERLALALSFALAGCRAGDQPPPAVAAQQPPPSPPSQSAPPRSDASCLAPLDQPASRVRLRPARGELRVGVLAGLKDAGEENVAHLRKLVAELKRRGAEVLIADGDLGDNPDEQKTLLSALTGSGLLLLAVAGNREVRSELDAAEGELRKKGAQIADLSHARVVDLGDAVVVGLPGAFERRQLHSDGVCAYAQKDLDALAAFLDKADKPAAPPVLLVAAVPPRGQDARALDASEGQNVGDPRLAALLRKARFGIFGEVWESGGRGIDRAGRPVAQGAFADELYVNPGAADRTPWPLGDGTTSAGQAALLTLRGRRAAWEAVRLEEAAQ